MEYKCGGPVEMRNSANEAPPGGCHAVFMEVFDGIKEDCLKEIRALGLAEDVSQELQEYYATAIEYNCKGGKLTRGLTVIKAAEATLGRSLAAEGDELKKAAVLGWCVEFLQSFFLVADDVMDSSVTRRGAPCWYRRPGISAANAINDSLMLESLLYRIIRLHFPDNAGEALVGAGTRTQYCDWVREMTFKTVVGQHLDTNAQLCNTEGTPECAGGASAGPRTTPDLSRFTMSRYRAIVVHKTAYYTFFLPCALGLTFAGQGNNSELLELVENICLELGEYFQAQDDFLDCFGEPEVIGKVGTDIEESKCSWLVCKALTLCSEEQKKVLEGCYGRRNAVSVEAVKDVYRELRLEEHFAQFEEERKSSIEKLIAAIQSSSLQSLFNFLLSKLYKRNR